MKIIKPKPFTFEAGSRAVLLLHGFTGHSADVRMLGRYLEKKNYTSHAPIYRGHGLPPEALAETNPSEWWEDVMQAYNHLRDLGYTEIAVAGLSIGGVLGLKLAYSEKIKAVIPMSTPMFFDNEAQLTHAFRLFAKEYKELQSKTPETVETELQDLMGRSKQLFQGIGSFVKEVSQKVDNIYSPTMVIQAGQDQMINLASAQYIYEQVETDHKEIVCYEESSHVVTLDKEREQLHEDVYMFLESLEWEND